MKIASFFVSLFFCVTCSYGLPRTDSASTMPTTQPAKSPPMPVSKVMVPPMDHKDRPLWVVVQELRQKTGVGMIMINLRKQGTPLLGNEKVSFASKKAVSLTEVLKQLSRECKSLHWRCLEGAIVLEDRGIASVKDNPLLAPVKPVKFSGTIGEMLSVLSANVSDLYPTWSGPARAWESNVSFETDKSISVEALLARTAADCGLRWSISLEYKVREQKTIIRQKGQKGQKGQFLILRRRTQFSCGRSGSGRKVVRVFMKEHGKKDLSTTAPTQIRLPLLPSASTRAGEDKPKCE